MATVSEFLLIQIGIDVNKIKKDASEAKRQLTDVEKHQIKLVESFKKGEAKVKAFFAVLAGTSSVATFIANVVGADAALNRLSKTTGMSVESISAWSNAAEHAGGSAGEMQAGIAGMSKELTKFKYTGDSTLIPFLNQMGVSIIDNNGKMKDQAQIMLELSDQAQKMPKEDFSNLAGMNGFNQSQINLMLQGRKALEAQIKEQNKNNLVTKQQAEEAAKAESAWVDLKQSFMGVARSVAYVLIPPLVAVAKVLTAMFTFVGNHKELLGILFLFAIPKLLAFNKGFLILLRAMTGITPVLKIATFAMRGFGLSTLIALAPLLLIGTGLALLFDDFMTFQAGGDSWIPWGKIFGGAEDAVKTVKDLIGNLTGLKDVMGDIAKGNFAAAKEKAKEVLQTTGEKMRAGGSAVVEAGGQVYQQAKEKVASATMADSSKIIAEAAKDIGVTEKNNRANVMQYQKDIGYMSKSLDAWCASFVGSKLEKAGFKSTRSPSAASYLKYGTAADMKKPLQAGMIAVMPRKGGSGYHVAIVEKDNGDGTATLINGNWGHGVKRSIVKKSSLASVRVPVPANGRTRQANAPVNNNMVSAGSVLFGNKGGNHAYDDIILAAANQQGIPPNILKGLIHQESQFNPHARSKTNAKGLAQFTTIALKDQRQRGYNINPDDPVQSIHGAARILRDNYRKFGDWTPAIAAYNAGAGAVAKNGNRPLTDTKEHREYAKRVLDYAKNERFSKNIAEGTGQVPFVTPPVGAKAHHALKHGHKTTHNHITSSTVIHEVKVFGHSAEDAVNKGLHKLQKAKELNNNWYKAAQYNNSAMM